MATVLSKGTFIGWSADFPSDFAAWIPSHDSIRALDYPLQGTRPYQREIATIKDSDDWISGSETETQLYIHHADGSSTALPVAGGAGAIHSVAVSPDGLKLAFVSGTSDHVTIYNYLGLALVGRIPLTEAIATSNVFVAFNSDGSKVAVCGSGKKLEVFITATLASDFISAGTYTVRGLGWNPADSKWMMVDSGQELHLVDSGGTLIQESNMHTGNKVAGEGFSMSPDETTLLSIGNSASGAVKAMDMTSGYADIAITPPSGTDCHYAWLDNSTLYAFACKNTVHRIYKYGFSGGVFSSPEDVAENPYLHPSGRFLTGSSYEVIGTIIDTAEETQFRVSLWTQDGSSLLGQVDLADGVLAFTCPCATHQPVMVIITGLSMLFHTTDTSYSVNDVIYVGDTKYSYTCTTAGVTALTKPAYPTTGTITDGSAIFTVRGLLPKPAGNFPVYPTVA